MKKDKKMKILIVRFQRIGDAILASPLCNSLKKSFPNSQIDYVLYEAATPVFENHPYIDNVICISRKQQKNPFLYVKRVWEICKEDYDIVIDIMSTPKSELFTLFSPKAKYRIGRYKKKRGFTYTHKQKEPENTENKTDKFLKQLLPPLEEEYQIIYDPKITLGVSPEEKKEMKERMEEAGIDFERPVVAFPVIARTPGKTYPLDLMKQVLRHCLEEKKLQVVFFFSPDQKELVQGIAADLGNPKDLFCKIETKDIRGLMAILANADCLIGNEGGPRHMAQALGLPCFAIYHPASDLHEWLPFPSESNVGIIPYEMLDYHHLSQEEFQALTKDEKFRLMTPKFVNEKIDDFLKVVLKNK